ncbi:MAG: TonB C-terminal domain-containing protein [Pseudobdellovibrionaceae bacterium]|nr:TonB C-terminal domain-containing protein [Bdellovibrionales bacterium]USN47400.1 MAG: TonB C-terminal domain-containing protein [Pseudobdellovibrionaceae bacterium]
MRKTFIFHGLILSVAIHIFLLWTAAQIESPPSRNKSAVDIVVLDRHGQKTVVEDQGQTSKLEELKKKIDEQTQLVSKRTQRVKKQQIAHGKPGGKKAPNKLNNLVPKNDFSEIVKKETSVLPNSLQENVVIGDGGTQNYIPMISKGGFTSLNTDQFLFYTYYARINQQVGSRWSWKVNDAIRRATTSELYNWSNKERVTQVEVILDPQGRHHKTLIHTSSGVEELDEAVTQTFLQATPFINPPEEMIQDDGYIHLHYAFHIFWDPRQIARGER